MIVLQPPLLCDEWGGRLLHLSGDSLLLMDFHWSCDCTAQSSIVSIGSMLPFLLSEFSPFLTVVKSFTGWHALLLLFVLRIFQSHYSVLSSFYLCFFMHLLILLFISLYFSDSSGSNHFFLRSLLFLHRSRIYSVTQSFFFSRCLPRMFQSFLC